MAPTIPKRISFEFFFFVAEKNILEPFLKEISIEKNQLVDDLHFRKCCKVFNEIVQQMILILA